MLCEQRGRFLFECRPDLFPPYLTDVERALWGQYYADKAAAQQSRR
jgi:hypothetical protein